MELMLSEHLEKAHYAEQVCPTKASMDNSTKLMAAVIASSWSDTKNTVSFVHT